MKKRMFDIAYALVSLSLLLAFGYAVAHAQQGEVQTTFVQFIPAVYRAQPTYSIQGKVVNQQNTAVQGVTIRTNTGQQTLTDQSGMYSLSGLLAGTYIITPSKSGMVFSPTSTVVLVPPDAANINFTAQFPTTQAIVNGGFEDNTAWVMPVTEYSAGYTTAEHHSGSRSMRTGIANLVDNRASDSTAEQKVTIPAGTTISTLTFWIKSFSGTTGVQALPPEPLEGASLDSIQTAGDVQYVLVLDSNLHIIKTLVWQLSNSRTWTQYQFSLAAYAGSTIWIHFGTTNDGVGGIASMFVDDVSLENSAGGNTPTPLPTFTPTPSPTRTPTPTPTRTPSPTPTRTPTPGVCTELIINNNFDLNSGWTILDTAYHAGYSNLKYHSPSRSMRSGIVTAADNVYSYSDFRQVVTIPASARHVTLSTWEYFTSSEVTSAAQLEQATPTGRPFSETVLTDDVQYLLVLDQNQNWIGTLIWQRSNTQVWTNLQFDLSAYAGKTIILQWGTFNNGTGGISAMYVDDVSLQACP